MTTLKELARRRKPFGGKSFRQESILKARGVKTELPYVKIRGGGLCTPQVLAKGKYYSTKTVQYDDYPNAENFIFVF